MLQTVIPVTCLLYRRDGLASVVVPVPDVAVADRLGRAGRSEPLHSRQLESRDSTGRRQTASDVTARRRQVAAMFACRC